MNDRMGNLVTLRYPRGPNSSMVEHLVQFQKGLGSSPGLVTFHAAIMKSMCKHWGLHISTNINHIGAFLGSFWAVWKGLLWCLKAKLRSWRFPRYWQFNKRYHGGYQLICLISWPLLIASRHDWYRSKGLLKGFKLVLRPWELSKNWWRYDQMKFVTVVIVREDYWG